MDTKQRKDMTVDIERSREADAVIIGGGLAGLAAATLLGRSGKRVVLFEKAATTGGRAASQEHRDYVFNLGAHALYAKSPAAEVLNELGVTFTSGTPTGIRCTNGDRNFLAPVDTTSLLRTELLGAGAKWEAARLLLKLQMADPQKYAGITVSQWLDKEANRTEVRQMMEASARVVTYTDAPRQMSMDLFIEQARQASSKVLYVDGGWQTLVKGLEGKAREAGVQILTGTRIEAVEHTGGQVTGVRLPDGTLYRAEAVVIAAGPKEALQIVAGGEQTVLRDWAERAVPVKAACLDVALRRLPNPANKVVMSVDRPLFLTVPSEFAKVAPKGGALVHGLMYLDPATQHDAHTNEQILEGWLDQTQPGWRDEVVERRYLPNPVVNNALVKASHGGLKGRPGPQVPGVSNLYVAGDWVGPRGLLASASLWSAKMAAQAIAGAEVGLPVAA